MNKAKQFLGIVWVVIGLAAIVVLVAGAFQNISSAGKGDINKPIPWIIIISIFTPIAIGLMVFGWYAFKGEYDTKGM